MPKGIKIRTGGHTLGARYWSKNGNEELVIIGPAMGVSQYFYTKFADYLHKCNFDVLTFDYHGIGKSLDKSLRSIESDVKTWAQSDLGGCIRWADNREYERLLTICHSLSGQILGLAENVQKLDKIVTIAASSGYWNQYQFPKNITFYFVWSVLYPLSTRLMGYFPAELIGLGENLPRKVALQVSRWGRRAGYIKDYSRYERIQAPILSISFSDDSYCPKAGVDWIHQQYKNATVHRVHIDLSNTKENQIGHFGFFRKKLDPMWNDVIEWLRV